MLTDKQVKAFKPEATDKKKTDAQGLYLLVKKNGSKLWQMAYRYNGKQKVLSFGPYPLVSLADARQARDDAKRELTNNIDPGISKKQRKEIKSNLLANTFENVARAWWETYKDTWTERHAHDVINSLEKKIFPYFGDVVLHNISTPLIYEVIKKMESKGTIETAQRVRQRVEGVFNYAISTGLYTENNPASLLKGALKKVTKKRNQPSITNLDELKQMMRVVDEQPAHSVTKLAYRFLSIVVVRPGEVRGMRWEEIQGDTWVIPAQRMKMKKPHKVFLSKQALEILSAVEQFSKNSLFVFPNSSSHFKPMSENAMGYLINRAGYKDIHCPHGFRSFFSSIMNERFPQDRAIIDLMLAHVNKNNIEAAYNRAEYKDRRAELYQIYADILFADLTPVDALVTLPRR